MTGAGFPHSDIHGSKLGQAAPRGFSQPPTSFIGSRRQGIHRWLFVAWKNKDARARYAVLKGRGGRRQRLRGRTSSMRTDTTKRTCLDARVRRHRGRLPQNGREDCDPPAASRRQEDEPATETCDSTTDSQCINWEYLDRSDECQRG